MFLFILQIKINPRQQHFALKILNPVGYKLERKATLKQCKVLVKGDPQMRLGGGEGGGAAAGGAYEPLAARHVWWLCHVGSAMVVAAFHDVEKGDLLREMTLPRCVQVWGLDHDPVDLEDDADDEGGQPSRDDQRGGPEAAAGSSARAAGRPGAEPTAGRVVVCDGKPVAVPALPPKYRQFPRARARMYREISSMSALSAHPNVLKLDGVLEMLHDSKTTLFLVLELAKGGELFDRIAIDEGAAEDTARRYFEQLLRGVRHCHEQGVCHRDLKVRQRTCSRTAVRRRGLPPRPQGQLAHMQ